MNINLIGVPIYFGSDIKGVDHGPEKLREKRIIEVIKKNHHNIYDLGNLYVPRIEGDKKFSFHDKMKYLDPVVEVNTNLAHQVYSALATGSFPFVVGGDHSIGLGSISGASKFNDNLAVIWVDAHGDINTHETTPSGNIHGMPLAAAMGIGYPSLTNLYYQGQKVKPENVYIIGARDLDEGEVALAKELKLNLYTAIDILERGLDTILEEIAAKLKETNIEAAHLSFDIDCLDPALVPGTGTPVKDGMNIEEAKKVLRVMIETKLVKSMDLVELNSLLDKDDATAEIAVDLIDWTFKCFERAQ